MKEFIYRIIRRFQTKYPIELYREKGLFIHIPKNAGTSLIRAIYGNLYRRNHITVNNHKKLLGSDFDKIHKFAVIRDPIDRLTSLYRYFLNGGNKKDDLNFSKVIKSECANFEDFVNYVKNNELHKNHKMFLSQWSWISINNKIAVDELIEISKIPEFLKKMKYKELHINQSKHSNKNQSNDVVITDKLKSQIMYLYAEDYEKIFNQI